MARFIILLPIFVSASRVRRLNLQPSDLADDQVDAQANDTLEVPFDDEFTDEDSPFEQEELADPTIPQRQHGLPLSPMNYMQDRFKVLSDRFRWKFASSRLGGLRQQATKTPRSALMKGRDALSAVTGHYLAKKLPKQMRASSSDLVETDFADGGYDLMTYHPQVWTKPIHSEPEFANLVRLTYLTAKRWALVTSFGCNPAGNGYDSRSTGAALWESVLRRMGDDVTLIFAYNKDVWRQAPVRKTTVNVEEGEGSGWQSSIVDPLVRSGTFPRLDNKGRLRAKIYFVEMDPIGFFGSWHTKFYINDQHLYATGGWSVANQVKMHWIDAGVVTSDAQLAKDEAAYFIKHMLTRPDNNIYRVTYDGPYITYNAESQMDQVHVKKTHKLKDIVEAIPYGVSFTRVQLDSAEVADLKGAMSVLDPSVDSSKPPFLQSKELLNAGFREADVDHPIVQRTVIPIRNIGWRVATPEHAKTSNLANLKPINLAIVTMIENAMEGDTLWIRNKALMANMHIRDTLKSNIGAHSQVWSWIRLAARKRVKVNILFLEKKLRHSTYDKLHYMAHTFARAVYGVETSRSNFTAEMKATVSQLLQVRRINYPSVAAAGVPIVCDHAKVYALEKFNGDIMIGIGTWNTDAQSLLGSNENMLFFDENKRGQQHLFQRFLKDVWETGENLDTWSADP